MTQSAFCRLASLCQSITASWPASSTAWAQSRSDHVPGKTAMPNLTGPLPPAGTQRRGDRPGAGDHVQLGALPLLAERRLVESRTSILRRVWIGSPSESRRVAPDARLCEYSEQ